MQYSTPLIGTIYGTQLGSSAAKLVALNLALAAHQPSAEFTRPLRDIARDVEMSERVVRMQIEKLIGLGVIVRVVGAPSTYRFNLAQLEALRAAFPEKVRA